MSLEMDILIIGDIHGDWGKLNSLLTKKQPNTVFQCGDFGWWPKMEVQKPVPFGRQKKWLLKGVKPGEASIYWCDGNHEEHEILKQDGCIHEMYPGVLHCSRGSTIALPDGRVVLFAGGASSVDKNMRTPGHDWFPQEVITELELDRMLSHARVDIVISHTCPTSFLPGLRDGNVDKVNDPSCKALEYVLAKYKPKLWYFGHWHMYKEGYARGCRWTCLNYPGHGSKWWLWLPE